MLPDALVSCAHLTGRNEPDNLQKVYYLESIGLPVDDLLIDFAKIDPLDPAFHYLMMKGISPKIVMQTIPHITAKKRVWLIKRFADRFRDVYHVETWFYIGARGSLAFNQWLIDKGNPANVDEETLIAGDIKLLSLEPDKIQLFRMACMVDQLYAVKYALDHLEVSPAIQREAKKWCHRQATVYRYLIARGIILPEVD